MNIPSVPIVPPSLDPNYTPNFTDKRVLERLTKAIGYVDLRFGKSPQNPREIHSNALTEHLGSLSSNLGNYLRTRLLEVTNPHYIVGERCMAYRVNLPLYSKIKELITPLLGKKTPAQKLIVENHHEELVTGKFVYTEACNRQFSPLQSLRKDERREILQEYKYVHEYDIDSAAQTTIYQFARTRVDSTLSAPLTFIEDYIKNKSEIRARLSNLAKISITQSKKVLTALFAGAILSRSEYSSIYNLLDQNTRAIKILMDDPWIQGFRADIKTMWASFSIPRFKMRYSKEIVETYFDEETNTTQEKTTTKSTVRTIPIKSTAKWDLYFSLERLVMDSIYEVLDARSIRYLKEHDGFTCDQKLDSSIIEHIYKRTGLLITLSYVNTTRPEVESKLVFQPNTDHICSAMLASAHWRVPSSKSIDLDDKPVFNPNQVIQRPLDTEVDKINKIKFIIRHKQLEYTSYLVKLQSSIEHTDIMESWVKPQVTSQILNQPTPLPSYVTSFYWVDSSIETSVTQRRIDLFDG